MFLDGFILIKKLILKNIIVNYLCFSHIGAKEMKTSSNHLIHLKKVLNLQKVRLKKKQEEYEKKGVNLDDVEAISQYIDDNTCSEYFAPG